MLTVSLVLIIIGVVIVGITAGADRNKLMTPDEAVKYSDVKTEDLINAVRNAPSFEEMDLEVYAAMVDRVSDLSADEFAELLEDNLDSAVLTRAFISAAEEACIEIPDALMLRLLESDLAYEVRLEALFYCSSSSKDYTEILADLTDDPELASFALRELYQKDPDRALEIADAVIAEYNGSYDVRLMGALHVKQYYLHENGTDEEIAGYIELCDDVIKGCKKDDESVRTVLLDLIGSIDSRRGLEYIIDNDDYAEKTKMAWYNSNTVTAILNGAPDEASIKLVFRALEKDLSGNFETLLRDNLSNNTEFYAVHPELAEKAQKILTLSFDSIETTS